MCVGVYMCVCICMWVSQRGKGGGDEGRGRSETEGADGANVWLRLSIRSTYATHSLGVHRDGRRNENQTADQFRVPARIQRVWRVLLGRERKEVLRTGRAMGALAFWCLPQHPPQSKCKA